MRKLIVKLPDNRDYAGTLHLEDEHGGVLMGPFFVCGGADLTAARRHGNPTRDPLLPFGNTPLGRYRLGGIAASGSGTSLPAEHFGAHGVLVLRPTAGDAALADANGRFYLLIQGGGAGSSRRLRPTNGSLRLTNRDQKRLVGILRHSRDVVCECRRMPRKDAARLVAVNSPCNQGDPPLAGSLISLQPVMDAASDSVSARRSSHEGGRPPRFGPPKFHLFADSGGSGGGGAGGDSGYAGEGEDNVDHSFISESEGGQTLEAAVPDSEGSHSGVTIATGVDLGQLSQAQLDNLDISTELRSQLQPYIGLQGDDAQQFLAQHPLTVTAEQAEQLDRAVLDPITEDVRNNFNQASSASFSTLPQAAQTAIADVAVQYGSNLAHATPNFWTAVTEGRWQDAVDELRDFGDRYPTRRGREADLLQGAIDRGELPPGRRQ